MTTHYLEILPLVHLPRTAASVFTYSSEKHVQIGSVILTKFNGRRIRGIVIGSKKKKPSYTVKPILKTITSGPYFSTAELSWIKSLSKFYVTQPSEIARLFITNKIPHKTLDACVRKKFTHSNIRQKTTYLTIESYSKDLSKLQKEISKTISSNAQALLLFPTNEQLQDAKRIITKIFPKEKIVTLHSGLTSKEHSNAFQSIALKEVSICIGLRHAIFAPFANLELIIQYDHANNSYKQWDLHPKYSVGEALALREKYLPAKYKLYSHAPSIVHTTKVKKITSSISDVVTFLERKHAPGTFSPLHDTVQRKFKSTCDKQRWLFFINRKGVHRYITCQDCHWEARCHNCNLILIQQDAKNVSCNRCDTIAPMPLVCAKCGGSNLIQLGVGIEKVKEQLLKLKKGITPIILDTDTFTSESFLNDKIILVTDTISRMPADHQFDNVVMVNADSEQSRAEWNAEEVFIDKVYRLAHHTKSNGNFYIQTSKNEELSRLFSIPSLTKHLQEVFAMRKKLYYPPYGEIILLTKKIRGPEKPLELPELKKLLDSKKRVTYVAQLYTDKRGKWQRIVIRHPVPTISFKKELYAIVPKDWKIEVNPLTV